MNLIGYCSFSMFAKYHSQNKNTAYNTRRKHENITAVIMV